MMRLIFVKKNNFAKMTKNPKSFVIIRNKKTYKYLKKTKTNEILLIISFILFLDKFLYTSIRI
jgi:hypothetical protein